MHEESAEQHYSALIHDDREIQADAIAKGDAFRGTVVDARNTTPEGRKLTPVWTIDSPESGPLRLREGSYVCVVGMPGRRGSITSIERLPSGDRRFEVNITEWKLARPMEGIPSAVDPSLVRRPIVMVSASFRGLGRTRVQRVWRRDVPGAWLTHAAGPAPDDRPDEVVATA